MIEYKSKSRTAFLIFNYTFLTIVGVSCLLPFIHLLALSFSSSGMVAAGKVTFFPRDFTLAAYEYAFKGGKFLAAFWVSIKRVVIGVSLNLFLITTVAYPLSRSKSKFSWRGFYSVFFLITMIFNGGIIPTYIVVNKVGIMDTIWALVLPTGLPVFSMIILMNFIRGLPDEIEESAYIDGAGIFQILLRIVLPLLKPSLATVGLFSIVYHWNDWFAGLVYMDSSNYPLQTYLMSLVRNFEEIIRMALGDYAQLLAMMNVRTGRAAQLFLGALPVLAIYPFLQKYFTTGLVLGSVKG
jgi:putative aldouronate transport system permease protein